MKFSFKKIGSILASTAMLSSTVALAAAANFPAPFVTSAGGDVGIVWGGEDTAALSDFVAVVDIQSALSDKLAALTASGGSTGGTTNTVAGGDYIVLGKSSDRVNLGDEVNAVFGSTVDDDDLPMLLKDGKYLNDENTEFPFEQKILLGNWSLTHFADSDYNKKEPTIGVRIAASKFVLNYTIDFTTDAESDVGTDLDLTDFETTTLSILGKQYYISDFDNATLDITFLDTANSGLVTEGETTSVTSNGVNYDVSIAYIDSDEVKYKVNTQLTNKLTKGQSYRLSDGTYIGAKEIDKLEVSGELGSSEFSLGSGKLEILNGNQIELNDVSVPEIKGYVDRASASSGGKTRVNKITLEWTTDEDGFITPTSSLTMPGFGAMKLSMGEIVADKTDEITVDWDGDDSIELKAPIKSGVASFNLLYANSTGEWAGLGKDASTKLVTTNESSIRMNITNGNDEWFVASYNSSSQGESYLLKVASIRAVSGVNKTTIRNVVTGADVCVDKNEGDTCDMGDVSITISQAVKLGAEKIVNITAGTGVSFHRLFTKSGLVVYLPVIKTGVVSSGVSDQKGVINVTNTTAGSGFDTFNLWFGEEDKDDALGAGKYFNVTLDDDSNAKVHVSAVATGSGNNYDIPGTDSDTSSYVKSAHGTRVDRVVSSNKGKAVITYNNKEQYGEIVLSDLTAAITTTGSNVTSTGGTVKTLGNVHVTDTEASSVASKNLIVVGGSCVNTVAAELLGVSAKTCGADFTEKTKVGSGQYLIETFARTSGKVATLVAGYNAGDTTNAAKALTTQVIDTTAGKKYTGSTSTDVTAAVAAA